MRHLTLAFVRVVNFGAITLFRKTAANPQTSKKKKKKIKMSADISTP